MLGQTVNHTIKEIGEVFSTAALGEYKKNEMALVNVISSGFVDVTIVCFDQNDCVFERKLTRNIMIFGYEGEGLVEVDDKKQILKPDDSLRIMRGSHIRMYPTTGQLKIGLTNFYI